MIFIQNELKISKETPKTDIEINRVSQSEAVITTGKTFIYHGCSAPWLKINTFWTLSGKINPNARINP